MRDIPLTCANPQEEFVEQAMLWVDLQVNLNVSMICTRLLIRRHGEIIQTSTMVIKMALIANMGINKANSPINLYNKLSKLGMSLEDIVKTLANDSFQFKQETRASIKNLET